MRTKRQNILHVITLGGMVLLSTSCAKRLPGASGQRIVELHGPLSQYSITKMVIATEKDVAGTWPAQLPQVFPSHTEELRLVVGFRDRPLDGTSMSTTVKSDSGNVKLAAHGTSWQFELGGEYFIMQAIRPASGEFPDGAYECVVSLRDRDVALLNWSVGGQRGLESIQNLAKDVPLPSKQDAWLRIASDLFSIEASRMEEIKSYPKNLPGETVNMAVNLSRTVLQDEYGIPDEIRKRQLPDGPGRSREMVEILYGPLTFHSWDGASIVSYTVPADLFFHINAMSKSQQ